MARMEDSLVWRNGDAQCTLSGQRQEGITGGHGVPGGSFVERVKPVRTPAAGSSILLVLVRWRSL